MYPKPSGCIDEPSGVGVKEFWFIILRKIKSLNKELLAFNPYLADALATFKHWRSARASSHSSFAGRLTMSSLAFLTINFFTGSIFTSSYQVRISSPRVELEYFIRKKSIGCQGRCNLLENLVV